MLVLTCRCLQSKTDLYMLSCVIRGRSDRTRRHADIIICRFAHPAMYLSGRECPRDCFGCVLFFSSSEMMTMPSQPCQIMLGAGTVGDIATPAERGKYMGMVTCGPMLGPSIGCVFTFMSASMYDADLGTGRPVFGGLLNQHLGWRFVSLPPLTSSLSSCPSPSMPVPLTFPLLNLQSNLLVPHDPFVCGPHPHNLLLPRNIAIHCRKWEHTRAGPESVLVEYTEREGSQEEGWDC